MQQLSCFSTGTLLGLKAWSVFDHWIAEDVTSHVKPQTVSLPLNSGIPYSYKTPRCFLLAAAWIQSGYSANVLLLTLRITLLQLLMK